MEEDLWHARLARQLVARHLQVSLSARGVSPTWRPPGWSWLPPENRYASDVKSRRRVVAVIGAGASSSVLPVGRDLVARLERELGVSRPADYEAELMRLQRVYGLPADFETRLVALCRRPEDERLVRNRISRWCGVSHPSVMAYELIAHLVKHRYIDAIVNFNYDELLDQSLHDEIGREEYVRVLSERDCHAIKTDPDRSGYIPLYIKMHGTASEPESLRFTRESYHWTPKPIIDVVEQLLDTENLVVINVGCRLASFDFQYLLRRPRNVSLFHVNPEPLDAHVQVAIDEFRGKDKAAIDAVFCGDGIASNKSFLPTAFKKLIKALKEEVKFETNGLVEWRPVGRHRVASKLLDADRIGPGGHNAEYLRQRTVLEVAFAAAKGRGVVSTTSLIDERCGHYYELYISAARREGRDIARWPTICRAGGLTESDDASDVYYADQGVCLRGDPPPPRREEPLMNHTLRTIDAERLATQVLTEIDSSKWSEPLSSKLHDQRRRLVRVIEKLRTTDELEIHSRDDRVCSKVFVDPLVLPTHTAFHAWSRELLIGDDYDELLVIAETGGWLARAPMLSQLGEGMVKLIAAFDVRKEALDKTLGGALEMKLIPWWRHNRHMRLLCKNGQPVRAIYYARLLRTSVVTPVFLQHMADLKRLKSGWDRLWQEAEEHEARLARHKAPDSPD